MEIAVVSDALDRLDRLPPKQLETQCLEFKSWCKNEKELSYEIAEAAVCLSNTAGGFIIVGVDDKKTAPDAILPCPYPTLSVDTIKRWIWDLTRPPVECAIARLTDIVPSLKGTSKGELFAIRVMKTSCPSGHRTNRGVSYIRIDTECRPQYFTEQDDYSALLLDTRTTDDISARSLAIAIKHRETRHIDLVRAGLQPIDHLTGMNLVRIENTTAASGKSVIIPTVAALLFFGRDEVLKQVLPAAETVLIMEATLSAPLTSSNWYNIQEALQNCLAFIKRHLAEKNAEISDTVLVELLLNAYLHRCYRTPGPIQILVGGSELEIRNPGGLLGSLTCETLLYGTPQYRNFLVADAARQFGYCEKAGYGIDKVYSQLILDGFDFPIFESDANSFKAVIRLKRDRAFANFIRDFGGGLDLKLTDLITLRALHGRKALSIGDLSKLSQRSAAYMEQILADLQRRKVVSRITDGRYALSEETISQIGRYDEAGQLKLF